MENHQHHSQVPNLNRAFKIGIALNVIFVIAEVFYGYVSGSMALIADAGHNLSDVMALVFAWLGVLLARKKPTLKFTYGFRRSTILIALLNTMLLWVALAFIAREAIGRFGGETEIKPGGVMAVAALGIVVNAFTAWLFVKGKKNDLNIRSAFVHFIADALVSLGVVVAGAVMALSGLMWIDTVVSVLIVVVILYSSWHLLVDSVNLALDAVPETIDIAAVRSYLLSIPQVSGIHDLHIWALGTTSTALTVHLTTRENTGVEFIVGIRKQLHYRFGIEHTTIQVEYGESASPCNSDCG